jgi:hypothetical protein
MGAKRRNNSLKSNPLHLVLRQPFLGAIVKLGRARAFMRSHRLGVLKRAAVAEIGSDPGRAERVIADRRHDAGGRCAAADHAPGIRLRHGLLGQHGCVVPRAGAEEKSLAILGDTGGIDVGA